MKTSFLLCIYMFIGSLVLGSISPVYAASSPLSLSFDPAAPNFTTGQQNVVTAVLAPGKGNISAATIVFKSTGGVKIAQILDAIDSGNTPFSKTKNIIDHTSDTASKTTVLFVKASSDLPTLMKIPVVVSGTGNGSLEIDTKASQVIDENGNAYSLSSKVSTITFSTDGKNSLPPPSPTPLPSTSVSLNLALKFQGVNPADVKTKTVAGVKVQLVSGTGNNAQFSIPVYITVSMDNSGMWRGTAVFPNSKPGSNYSLLVKGPKQLQKRICDTTPSEAKIGGYACGKQAMTLTSGVNDINIAGISLMAGDLGIQDGIENAFDLSFVQNILKKTTTVNSADADVNYDGKVTKADYDTILYTLANTSGLDQK